MLIHCRNWTRNPKWVVRICRKHGKLSVPGLEAAQTISMLLRLHWSWLVSTYWMHLCAYQRLRRRLDPTSVSLRSHALPWSGQVVGSVEEGTRSFPRQSHWSWLLSCVSFFQWLLIYLCGRINSFRNFWKVKKSSRVVSNVPWTRLLLPLRPLRGALFD